MGRMICNNMRRIPRSVLETVLAETVLLISPTEIHSTLPYFTQYQTHPPSPTVTKSTCTSLHTNCHARRVFRGRELASPPIYESRIQRTFFNIQHQFHRLRRSELRLRHGHDRLFAARLTSTMGPNTSDSISPSFTMHNGISAVRAQTDSKQCPEWPAAYSNLRAFPAIHRREDGHGRKPRWPRISPTARNRLRELRSSPETADSYRRR